MSLPKTIEFVTTSMPVPPEESDALPLPPRLSLPLSPLSPPTSTLPEVEPFSTVCVMSMRTIFPVFWSRVTVMAPVRFCLPPTVPLTGPTFPAALPSSSSLAVYVYDSLPFTSSLVIVTSGENFALPPSFAPSSPSSPPLRERPPSA